jgi:50S ribosomal protein L16 3-hydroxylase
LFCNTFPNKKFMTKKIALQHLDGMTANTFLQKFWQRKPLLIRNAFPDFEAPLTRQEIFELASREEAESRLIVNRQNVWSLQHGPFSRKQLRAAAGTKWTVLIQDTQHFSREAHHLLRAFNFVPHARIDDLMVSFANKGGGVGPHFDSYDVFLLQGEGERRWQISAQRDLHLIEGVPLKILANFKPEQEWVLKTGDMLYLPPGYAHHGVAESDCVTWSIGFRAPGREELARAYLDFVRDEIELSGNYEDRDLKPTATPGAIDADMERRMLAMLRGVTKVMASTALQRRFLGRYLTEPKSHVTYDTQEPVAPGMFKRMIARRGIELDTRSRLLSLRGQFFINGDTLDVPRADKLRWQRFADRRALDAQALAGMSAASLQLLQNLFEDGFIVAAPLD